MTALIPEWVRSPAWRTDLALAAVDGDVHVFASHLVVRTPSRPDYFWGNFVLFREAPREPAFAEWMALYREAFPGSHERFVALAWCGDEQGDVEHFRRAGFSLERSTVLRAQAGQVEAPPAASQLALRELKTAAEWEATMEVHFNPEWPYGDGQRAFLKGRVDAQRRMAEVGAMTRYGAFEGELLVADVGFFTTDDGRLGRFDSVGTHPEFRRRGICRRLIQQVSHAAFADRTQQIVIVADNAAAERVYRAVGYESAGVQWGLEWYRAASAD